MKLELDGEEVEAALLAFAEQKWPGIFNSVSGNGYSAIPGVIFAYKEPEPTDPVPLKVA